MPESRFSELCEVAENKGLIVEVCCDTKQRYFAGGKKELGYHKINEIRIHRLNSKVILHRTPASLESIEGAAERLLRKL